MQQVQNLDPILVQHAVGTGLPERLLAIAQAHGRPRQSRIALCELPPHPVEDDRNAAPGLGALVRQTGPDPLVAWLRSWPRFIVGITEQGGHNLGRRTHIGSHRVHRRQRRHAFLIGPLPGRTLPATHRRRPLAPDDDPFAVGCHDHDRLFLGCGRGTLQSPKHTRVLGLLPIHPFQTVHRLLQFQDAFDRLAHLAKRLLHGQRLIPILQHVGEDACGQLQTLVQRYELQSLAFPAAVDGPLQGERTEDGHIPACVQFRQTLDFPAVG